MDTQIQITDILTTYHNLCCKYDLFYWFLGDTLINAVNNNSIKSNNTIDIAMLFDESKMLLTHISELPTTMIYDNTINGIITIYNSSVQTEIKLVIHLYYIQDCRFPNYNYKKITVINSDLLNSNYNEKNYEYNIIFPVSLLNLTENHVYMPNNIKQICIDSFGAFPPISKL